MKNSPNFRVNLIALCSIITLPTQPSIAGDDDFPWENNNSSAETKDELPEVFFNELEEETPATNTPPWPPLHQAIATEGMKQVWNIVYQDPEKISSQDHLGQTPLHLSAGRGDYNIALFFLKNGANPHSASALGQTPLSFAVIGGNIQVIELLLGCGADINTRDINGRTSLYWAIARGNPEVVECLIRLGADVHIEYPENVSDEIFLILQNARNLAQNETPQQEIQVFQNEFILLPIKKIEKFGSFNFLNGEQYTQSKSEVS